MNDENTMNQYVAYINENILPFIDYDKLHTSYGTDMTYAKGILHLLHKAMIEIYGGDYLDTQDGDEGFVLVPGVVRGKKNGNICLALLEIDLSSSGEHWRTDFICKYGIVSQNNDIQTPAGKEMRSIIGSYDYCYTASIPCDIHINKSMLPKELKSILNDFREYTVDLTRKADTTIENSKSKNLYLLYSCNEWCEKSKASLLLVTSDKETLCAAIGGEILTGNMNYLGESGGKGFAAFKKDYLAGNDVMKELNYGFVKETDEALLSAPDTIPEYYTAASEFLAADFQFDHAEFDKAYNSEETLRSDDELDEEYDDEI